MSHKKKPIPNEIGNNFYKSGWKPGIEVNDLTGIGEITHVGTDPDFKSKYDEILQEWGFDPKKYEIEGAVKVSSWNTQLKGGHVETFHAFKGIVRKKKPGHDKYFKELLKKASKNHLYKQKCMVETQLSCFLCQIGRLESVIMVLKPC